MGWRSRKNLKAVNLSFKIKNRVSRHFSPHLQQLKTPFHSSGVTVYQILTVGAHPYPQGSRPFGLYGLWTFTHASVISDRPTAHASPAVLKAERHGGTIVVAPRLANLGLYKLPPSRRASASEHATVLP